MVSAEEPSHSRLDECFLTGCYQAPRQRSSPFFPEVLTSSRYCGTPPIRLASVLLLQLLSHLLIVLKKKDTSTCLLWISLWTHISAHPQLSDGRRGRAIHPSRAEPNRHSLTRLLGGWTRGFSAELHGCALGLPGQYARQ